MTRLTPFPSLWHNLTTIETNSNDGDEYASVASSASLGTVQAGQERRAENHSGAAK